MKEKASHFHEVMRLDIDVPVDCVIVAHFGCWFQWTAVLDELKAELSGTGTTIHTAYDTNHLVDDDHYDDLQEHFADFRLRVNGEDVCKTFSYSFLRQSQGTYLTGTLPVSAGVIEVTLDARIYRNNLGKIEQSKFFYYDIHDRNLHVHAKKR